MKVKIMGYSSVRSGEYQGRPYSNRKLSYVVVDESFTPKDYYGQLAEQITIPSDIGIENYKAGDTINLQYNRWGKVTEIIPVE